MPEAAANPGALYIVATPIGNLEDLSPRARRVLGEVTAIICEDTRHSRKLLEAGGLQKPLISFYEENEAQRLPELLARLRAGESLALISDAGAPTVADPGYRLTAAAAAENIQIVPVPGPSAVIAALMASGLPSDAFYFGGFLPARGGARRARLRELEGRSETLIFFEAPHRLCASLDDLREILGPQRLIAAGRELTKLHEEIVRGTLAEVARHFSTRAPRGEFTLVIAGAGKETEPGNSPDATTPRARALAEMRARLAQGLAPREALRETARATGIGRSEIYRWWEQEKEMDPTQR